jgi:multidrug efflux pump subunit AcrA (membrane-fusion protein)
MFVRVQIPVAERRGAVLVPEKAVSTDLGGKFLLAVGEENTLVRKDIKLGATVNGLRVVTEGLSGEETFIVGGFHMARPGMPIQPIPAGQMPPGMEMMPDAPQAADKTEITD